MSKLWYFISVSTITVWYGMVWYGMVWYGMVWYGIETLNVSLHRKQVKLQGIKFNHNTHFKADHI